MVTIGNHSYPPFIKRTQESARIDCQVRALDGRKSLDERALDERAIDAGARWLYGDRTKTWGAPFW
jgi:hypothetical protein